MEILLALYKNCVLQAFTTIIQKQCSHLNLCLNNQLKEMFKMNENKITNAITLTNDKDLRQKYIDRVDVLQSERFLDNKDLRDQHSPKVIRLEIFDGRYEKQRT